jgi:chemotaxis protein methyltransferase CheR
MGAAAMLGEFSTEKIQGDDFRWLQQWLYECSAIVLEDGRKFVAEKRLLPVLWKHQFSNFEALFRRIRGGVAPEIHADAIEALTSNETWFFRDPTHFDMLRRNALPRLMRARQESKTLRLWSAGCSTGQEAYSLAMLLSGMPELQGWKIWLLGTDLSYRQIQRAREGVYSQDEIGRGLPAHELMRHFDQKGTRWSAKAELRASVEFQVLRLDQHWKLMPAFDLVLIRNVLFHFDLASRKGLLKRLRQQLRPDGLLMLGALEKNDLEEEFEPVGDERNRIFMNVEQNKSLRGAG